MKNRSRYGFTIIEGLISLLCFSVVMVIIALIMKQTESSKKTDIASTQIKNMIKWSSDYLLSNYNKFISNANFTSTFVSFSNIGAPVSANLVTLYGQSGCLYIEKDQNRCPNVGGQYRNSNGCVLNAYLIFGSASSNNPLSKKDATSVLSSLGAGAGLLTYNNNQIKFASKYGERIIPIGATDGTQLQSTCNFDPGSLNPSFAIDISNSYQLKNNNTLNDTQNIDIDNTLKTVQSNQSSLTMQSDLYLDNVVAESKINPLYKCDDFSAFNMNSANQLCLNYGATHNYTLQGNAIITGAVLYGATQCSVSVQGNFYTTSPVCGSVPSAQSNAAYSQCVSPSNYYGGFQLGPINLNGNQCSASYTANYCTNSVNIWEVHYTGCNPQDHDMKYTCVEGTVGTTGYGCGDSSNNPNPCGPNMCAGRKNCWGVQLDGTQCNNSANQTCSTQTYTATQVANPAFGASCGTYIDSAQNATTVTPEQHQYRALDLGSVTYTAPSGSVVSNQNIRAYSNAAPGNPSTQSQLNIDNAGIKAGRINTASAYVSIGSACDSTQVGMMAQQQNYTGSIPTAVKGQLQCTYNPTYCSSGSYCFLPNKGTAFAVTYNPAVSNATCPSGSYVDPTLIDSMVDTSACANTIIKQPSGSVNPTTGVTVYNGIQGTCKNGNGNTIGIVNKLICSTVTNIFSISNYKQ